MKTSSRQSFFSTLTMCIAVLAILLSSAEFANAQSKKSDAYCFRTANTQTDVTSVINSCNSCGNCIVTVVGTDAYYVQKAGKAGANMKAIKNPKAVKAEDVAKMPGLANFRPFRGSDNVEISCSSNTLIFHGNEGTASENPLDLCQSDDEKQICKNPTSWAVTNSNPASNDGYTIQPTTDKKLYLCFTPSTGLTIKHRDPANTEDPRMPDNCTLWAVTPTTIGADGEITGYKITPKKHPEYVLAADTRSNQITVNKVNPKNSDAPELEKGVMAHWNFKPGKSSRPVTHQEKVIQQTEEK